MRSLERLGLLATVLVLLVGGSAHGGPRDVTVVAADGSVQEGTKWALIIGCNDYDPEQVGKLKVAVADARRVRDCLVNSAGFAPGNVLLLTDAGLETSHGTNPALRPTYVTLQEKLVDFCERHRGTDTLLIFFAGHGFRTQQPAMDYLAPLDVRRNSLPQTAVSVQRVVELLRTSGARQAALIVDACRTVPTATRDAGLGGVGEEAGMLAARAGVWWLSSCAPGQTSREDERRGGGLYTTYLVEGLSGAADGCMGNAKDGLVTVPEAQAYVGRKLEELTRVRGPLQTPTSNSFEVPGGGQMVLAVPGIQRPPTTGTLPPVGLGAGTLKATLVQYYPGTPPFFMIKPEGSDQAAAYTGADTLQYYQTAADGTVLAATASILKVGDSIEYALDKNGRITGILVSRVQVTGTIQAIGGGRVLLTDGQIFSLATSATVQTADGAALDSALLKRGDKVTLTLNPADKSIAALVLESGIATTPTTTAPQIQLVATDYAAPLNVGDKLTLRVRGTTGGIATVDLGDKVVGILLREAPAGEYTGTYTVKAGDDVTKAAVVGHLQVRNVDAAAVTSAQTVTIDTVEPVVLSVSPDYLAETATASPLITFQYYDENGSGIDTTKTVFKLDDVNVTRQAQITDKQLRYQASNLAAGEHHVDLALLDLAGNLKTLRTAFTVCLVPPATGAGAR